MTALTAPPRSGSVARIPSVIRLYFANPWTVLILPWLILGAIFAVNWAIWWMITASTGPADHQAAVRGFSWNGAVSYFFVYMLVVGVQAMTATFSYALGLGVTRRQFYLGSLVTFTGLSAVFALALTLLGALELMTNGWGVGGRMFTAVWFAGSSPAPLRFWVYFVGLLFFFTTGAAVAAVYVRWRSNGLVVFFVSVAAVAVAGAVLVTVDTGWAGIARWFIDAGSVGVATALLVPAAIAATAGYLILRRATPRE